MFNSGNLVLDMLHNFFLESGARMGKLRVYESSTNPVVKRLTGYLLCRGGVHQLAYAVALSKIIGMEMPKMLPIPDIRTDKIPECREFIAKNLHNTLYRFSPDDYKHIGDVFNGTHPEDGSPLTVREGTPDGHPLADLKPAPASGIPSFDMGEIKEIARSPDEKHVSDDGAGGPAEPPGLFFVGYNVSRMPLSTPFSTLLIALAAMLWGGDLLLRPQALSGGWSPACVVLGEHLLLTLVFLVPCSGVGGSARLPCRAHSGGLCCLSPGAARRWRPGCTRRRSRWARRCRPFCCKRRSRSSRSCWPGGCWASGGGPASGAGARWRWPGRGC